jgi:hypothetical protein
MDADLRRLLLAYSDHLPVQTVHAALTRGEVPELAELVAAMRATRGELAVVGHDGLADVYARWHRGGYDHLTLWPVWTVGGEGHADAAGLVRVLSRMDSVEPVPARRTPFEDNHVLSRVPGSAWP